MVEGALVDRTHGAWAITEWSIRIITLPEINCLLYLLNACPVCPIYSWNWVGLTLIRVFHQLPRRFCQIPISPGRIRYTVERSETKSTQPRCTIKLGTLYMSFSVRCRFPFLQVKISTSSDREGGGITQASHVVF